MTNLKTLKDFTKEVIGIEDKLISSNKLKAEAIKWVKEDKYFLSKSKNDSNNGDIILGRWMKRLNITEDNLKVVKDLK